MEGNRGLGDTSAQADNPHRSPKPERVSFCAILTRDLFDFSDFPAWRDHCCQQLAV